MQGICLYHNGNPEIISRYRRSFSHLEFKGNLIYNLDNPESNCFYEISFADADKYNLLQARKNKIWIIRHISDYEHDKKNLSSESGDYDYDFWLHNIVVNNLAFADEVRSEFRLQSPSNGRCAIITTGRAANTHLSLYLSELGIDSFQYECKIDNHLKDSSDAFLLWRLDQWEALCSLWIALHTDWVHHTKSRGITNAEGNSFSFKTKNPMAVDREWIDNDWANMAANVFNHAFFFKYILSKPVTLDTTERVIDLYRSDQQKIDYDKKDLILDYIDSRSCYNKSTVKEMLDELYFNSTKHIPVKTIF